MCEGAQPPNQRPTEPQPPHLQPHNSQLDAECEEADSEDCYSLPVLPAGIDLQVYLRLKARHREEVAALTNELKKQQEENLQLREKLVQADVLLPGEISS